MIEIPSKSARSKLESLHNGEYYPVGLPPSQVSPSQPFAKTLDAVLLVEELRRRNAGGTHLIVASHEANIFWRLLKNHPEIEEEDLQRIAREKARLIALKDLLLYESLQDQMDREGKGERVPVLLMSDITNHLGHGALMARLSLLRDSDAEFAEAVSACLPDRFKGNPEEFAVRSEYVLDEIANTLFLRGRKLGHAGEHVYDQAAELAAEKLCIATDGLSYQDLPLAGATGVSPYRAVQTGVADGVYQTLSARHDMDILRDPGIPTEDITETIRAIQAHEERVRVELPALHERVKKMNELYATMKKRAGEMENLSDADRQILIDSIDFQQASEILLTLKEDNPHLDFLLEESGISSTLQKGRPFLDGDLDAGLLPVSVKTSGSPERRFLQFMHAVVFREGLLFAHLPQIGVRMDLINALHDLSEGDFEGGWEPTFNEWRQFLLEVPLHSWAPLQKLFAAIRGTSAENAYWDYLGVDENVDAKKTRNPDPKRLAEALDSEDIVGHLKRALTPTQS